MREANWHGFDMEVLMGVVKQRRYWDVKVENRPSLLTHCAVDTYFYLPYLGLMKAVRAQNKTNFFGPYILFYFLEAHVS